MADNNRDTERLSTLSDQGNDDDLRGTTIEERWNMMRQLTVAAYAAMGVDVTNQPMRKDIERLITLKEK